MAIVKKHVDHMAAGGMTPEQVIKKSFGGDIMNQLPADPAKAKIADTTGLDLGKVNMRVSPELLKDLQALKVKRFESAQKLAQAPVDPSVLTQKVELPKGYKQCDIEKVRDRQRLQKLREREKK